MTTALIKRQKFVIVSLLWFIGTVSLGYSQSNLLSIHQIDSMVQANPKPVLILLSTDWCQYCQMQKLQIRKNKVFQAKESLFHYVEFDAESKEKVLFNEKEYNYKPRGRNIGTHELSILLNGSNKIAYPTWVLLDEQYNVQFRHPGVLVTRQLNELLEAIEKHQQ